MMIQGWLGDDYLILFEEQSGSISERYGIHRVFPGHTVRGLKSWDDFILQDSQNRYFNVSTVPLAADQLQPYSFPFDLTYVRPDQRFTDKIKWYVQPIIFGGDPSADANMAWITLDQHVEAVNYWNSLYLDLRQNKGA